MAWVSLTLTLMPGIVQLSYSTYVVMAWTVYAAGCWCFMTFRFVSVLVPVPVFAFLAFFFLFEFVSCCCFVFFEGEFELR